jgi:hypothetical protein
MLLISTLILGVLLAVLVGLALWLSGREEAPTEADSPPGTAAPTLPGTVDTVPTVMTDTEPPVSEPAATLPPETLPRETQPKAAEPQPTQPKPTEPKPTEPQPTQPKPTEPQPTQPKPTEPPVVEDVPLSVQRVVRFSGQFVEDGTDELVEHVLAILVTNVSDRFLDLGTVSYDVSGETATFAVTGLPPGRSAWVMESSRMRVNKDVDPNYLGCVTNYRSGVVSQTADITVRAEGNQLIAVNNTGRTLENVFVYYKILHTDGNFFGGITYLVNFGTIEPGGSAQSIAGHYQEGKTEIVRIGWQESR